VKAAGAVLRYTGVHTTSPVVASSGAGGDSNPLRAVGLAAGADMDRSMLVGFFGVKKKSTTLSTPTGMTSRSFHSSNGDITILGTDELRPNALATGDRTSNAGTIDKWVAQLFALRPAS
jgi:hypothetical protein